MEGATGFGLQWANEWSNKSNIHPLALVIVLVCCIAVLRVHRHYIIWPFAFIAVFVSAVQKLVVFGLDFNLTRILVLFGIIRFLTKPDRNRFVWHKIDKLIIYFSLSKMIVHILQAFSFAAFINSLGQMFDTIGLYFIFRKVFSNWSDIEKNIQIFGLLSIPVSIFFIVEYSTSHNLFSVFGGVREITWVRDGRLRCQGSFAHPIVAGCFWASLLPLIITLNWKKNKTRLFIIVASMLTIIFTTSSSTPLTAVAAGVIGSLMFYWRKKMRLIRWCILLSLIALHMVMKAPVWHLVSRINLVSGSTSWYRFALIDNFIRHISDWWLIGVVDVSHWDCGSGPCYDLANHFVLEGVTGGLLSLILFVAIISFAFAAVGDTWRRVQHDKIKLAITWSCGVVLFVHCTNFIGISYFGQIIMIWYMHLALIVSMDVFTKQALIK